MSLHRLVFDTANPAESANVGAFVRAGDDGTQIGHVSDALKVSLTNASIPVTQSGTWSVGRTWTLADTTDSVAVGNGANMLAVDAAGLLGSKLFDAAGTGLTSTLVSGKQALDVNVVDGISVTTNDAALADVALATEADTITTTSAAAIASPLANRKYVSLYNNGSKIIYIGSGTVTAASGFPIPPGSILEARIGAAVAINAVAQSGSQDLRVLQLS